LIVIEILLLISNLRLWQNDVNSYCGCLNKNNQVSDLMLVDELSMLSVSGYPLQTLGKLNS